MTINEKNQLTNYIKNLVRENIKKEKYPKDFKWEKEPTKKEIQKALWYGWDEQDKRKKEVDKQRKESGAKDYDEWKKEKQLKEHIKKLVRESLGEMDSMPNWWNDKYRSKMDSDEEDMIDLDDEEYDDEEDEPAFALSEEIKGSDLGGVFSTDDPKAAKAVRDDTDAYDDWYGESWSSRKGREDLSNLIDRRSRGEDAELERGGHSYNDSAIRNRQMEKDALDNEKAESDRYDRPFGDLDDTENLWSGDPDLESDDDEIAGLDELRKLAESYARQSVARILSESKKKKGKRKNKKEKTSSKDKTVVSQLNADGTNAAHYFYKLYGVENGTEAQKAAARSKGYKKAKGKKNDTGVPYKFSSKERNRLSSLLTDRS